MSNVMVSLRSLAVVLSGFAVVVTALAKEKSFLLPASVVEVVRDEGHFRAFAEPVRAEVARLLGEPAAVDNAATLKLLLASRVHLAHYFGDDDEATATAAWIRTLQTSPVQKTFAGLTTFAAVATRRQHPGLGSSHPLFRKTFAREFADRLRELPRTTEVAAMLREQRQKIADLSEADLVAEARDKIAPAIARRGFCGLGEADQLVRVRHRLVNILPLQAEMLEAFDAAIAERSAP
jgi:hypothetical protein